MSRAVSRRIRLPGGLPVEDLHLFRDANVRSHLVQLRIEGNHQTEKEQQGRIDQQKLTFHGAASVSAE